MGFKQEWDSDTIDSMIDRIESLESQRDKLRDALEDITQAAQQEGLQFSGWKEQVDNAVDVLKAAE